MTSAKTHAERIAALEAERPFNQQAIGILMDRFDKFETHVDARFDKAAIMAAVSQFMGWFK